MTRGPGPGFTQPGLPGLHPPPFLHKASGAHISASGSRAPLLVPVIGDGNSGDIGASLLPSTLERISRAIAHPFLGNGKACSIYIPPPPPQKKQKKTTADGEIYDQKFVYNWFCYNTNENARIQSERMSSPCRFRYWKDQQTPRALFAACGFDFHQMSSTELIESNNNNKTHLSSITACAS